MAKTRSGRDRNSNSVNVDFTGVESGQKKIPEGTYSVSLDEATIEKSSGGNNYIKMVFSVVEGKFKGSKLYHNCSLLPQALFNLKQVLQALGLDVPDKAYDLNLREILGLTCEVEVVHEAYEGKTKSVISEFISPEGDEEEELEDLLGELELSQLKPLAKEVGLRIKKSSTEESLIEELLEADEDEVFEAYDSLFGDDEEDEEDDEDEDDEIDYSEMSLAELRAECKDRGIKYPKGAKSKELISLLEEDDED